ncbi:MAG: hypothetical protein ACI9C1_002667, partial [Candidatus Aldehydirespiratoraceae bacterium]
DLLGRDRLAEGGAAEGQIFTVASPYSRSRATKPLIALSSRCAVARYVSSGSPAGSETSSLGRPIVLPVRRASRLWSRSAMLGSAMFGEARSADLSRRWSSVGRKTRGRSVVSRAITESACTRVMASTRSTSRSVGSIRRLRWPEMSRPMLCITSTACAVAGRPLQPRVPTEATSTLIPASPKRAATRAAAIGERHVLPVHTVRTRSGSMSSR